MKIAAAAFTASIAILTAVQRQGGDETEIPFAPFLTFGLTVHQHTVIVRRGTESVVVTKAAMRRYLNAKDTMAGLDPIPRKYFDGLLVHCQQPIAALFFAERSAALRRQGQGDKG